MKMNGAKAIVESLINLGITDIFGYPGGAIMPVYDALFGAKINHILVRHEQGAVIAAEKVTPELPIKLVYVSLHQALVQ